MGVFKVRIYGWESASQYIPPLAISNNGTGFGAQDNGVRLIDLNGDGLLDAIQHVWWSADNVQEGAGINTGADWKSADEYLPQFGIANNAAGKDEPTSGAKDNGVRLVDLNGDGMADFIQNVYLEASNIQKSAWINNQKTPNMVESINDGFGIRTSIEYRALTKDESGGLYTKSEDAKYPIVDLAAPLYVVSRYAVYDDSRSMDMQNFSLKYSGLKTHMRRRESLGFREIISTNERTCIYERTTYKQDFPFIGSVEKYEKRNGYEMIGDGRETSGNGCADETDNDSLLAQLENVFQTKTNSYGSVFSPYTESSTEKSYELDGKLIKTVTTEYTYDDYGNATNVSVTATANGIRLKTKC